MVQAAHREIVPQLREPGVLPSAWDGGGDAGVRSLGLESADVPRAGAERGLLPGLGRAARGEDWPASAFQEKAVPVAGPGGATRHRARKRKRAWGCGRASRCARWGGCSPTGGRPRKRRPIRSAGYWSSACGGSGPAAPLGGDQGFSRAAEWRGASRLAGAGGAARGAGPPRPQPVGHSAQDRLPRRDPAKVCSGAPPACSPMPPGRTFPAPSCASSYEWQS